MDVEAVDELAIPTVGNNLGKILQDYERKDMVLRMTMNLPPKTYLRQVHQKMKYFSLNGIHELCVIIVQMGIGL